MGSFRPFIPTRSRTRDPKNLLPHCLSLFAGSVCGKNFRSVLREIELLPALPICRIPYHQESALVPLWLTGDVNRPLLSFRCSHLPLPPVSTTTLHSLHQAGAVPLRRRHAAEASLEKVRRPSYLMCLAPSCQTSVIYPFIDSEKPGFAWLCLARSKSISPPTNDRSLCCTIRQLWERLSSCLLMNIVFVCPCSTASHGDTETNFHRVV